ncbi:MAG: aldo/keto reductase [Chloroflexota bacterium]
MELQKLGSTNLDVTRLGLGLAALGRPGYITLGHADDLNHTYDPAEMERHAHAILDMAYAQGVRYFDAARSYGRAEAYLASWLQRRNIPSEAVTIGSKWGYTYTADWQIQAQDHEVKEHSLPRLQHQWQESQAYLSDTLKLYQIHSATLESGVLDNMDVLNELARLKQEENVAIGLSVSGAKQPEIIKRAINVVIQGERLFDTVQATWNLLEPSAGKALSEASDAGMGIIIKEVLANGRLTERNPNPTQKTLLRELTHSTGASIDQIAIAAALAQPWVSIVLSGAAQIAHLQSNLSSTNLIWDEAHTHQIAQLVEPAETYWQTRSDLAWN